MTDNDFFAAATPRPWRQGRGYNQDGLRIDCIYGHEGEQVTPPLINVADAPLIVAAVNSYRAEPQEKPHDYEGLVCKNCGEKYDRLKSTIWCLGRAEPSDEDVERVARTLRTYGVARSAANTIARAAIDALRAKP